ncbi:MAG: hypothetical protein O3B90_12625, partial [Actinomycetota bacterium]|nr:hypothetical protein [Actinomycetota bacterium]
MLLLLADRYRSSIGQPGHQKVDRGDKFLDRHRGMQARVGVQSLVGAADGIEQRKALITREQLVLELQKEQQRLVDRLRCGLDHGAIPVGASNSHQNQ